MQTKKIVILTVFLIIFLAAALVGCAPKSSELEKTVMQLQDEIAKKEEAIKKLQENTTESTAKTTKEETTTITEEDIKASLTDDAKALLVIDSYINAIESKDFTEQKKYVAKYALDLVNFKEYESKGLNAEIREIERKPSKIDKITGNNAEGFMSFTEHTESLITKDKYDLITEGKVYLEKINEDWKIVDYTRKDRLISEALYTFKDFYKELKNVKISIDLVLFSIFDDYAAIRYTIENNNDFKISTSASSSKIIGPDKQQNEVISTGGGDLYEILPNAISIGYVDYNWTNESAGDFKVFFGDVHNADNYNNIIKDLTFDVALANAIRY
jgi:hypothetical protein